MTLWRMQDKNGRGPFKPGFTNQWKDKHNLQMQEIIFELPDLVKLIPSEMYAGFACKSWDDLNKWFDRSERRRLKRFDYEIVTFEPDIIVFEAITQVIFANKRPLRELSSKEIAK